MSMNKLTYKAFTPCTSLPDKRLHSRYDPRRSLPVVLALLAATLAGCTVGPNYVRPTAPVPVEFKEAQGWKLAQPGDELPRGAWWTVFNDDELNALEAQVDFSNQTLKAAEARVRQAQTLVQQARAAFFPTLDGSAEATRGRAARQTRSNYNVGLNASWEPDLWGRVRRSVEASSANVEASAADLESARLVAQAELATNYLQLRVQDAVTA